MVAERHRHPTRRPAWPPFGRGRSGKRDSGGRDGTRGEAMGAVLFYHLTRRPLEHTLRQLLERALASGLRVAVRGTSEDRLRELDDALWAVPEESFLPHAMAGSGRDARQPVILTTSWAGNGATCLMAIDGAEVTAEEAAAMARACILFDGRDGDAVAHARGQWKRLADAGAAAQYWSEEGGAWAKKAEAGGG